MNIRKNTRNVVYAGVCIAIGLILPTLLGGIQNINSLLSPMHIPVLVSGFLCGPIIGAFVGFVTPLLRSVLFSMPPMAVAIPMAFELMVYGIATGVLFKLLPKTNLFIFVNVFISMILGRVFYAIVVTLLGSQQEAFFVYLVSFLTGAIITMVLHFIIVPPIIIILKRLGYLNE